MVFTKPGGSVLDTADVLGSDNFDFKLKKEISAGKLMAVSTDKRSYSRTEKMQLYIEMDLKDGKSKTFDLYISLIDPDGITSSLMPDLALSRESTRAKPILTNFKLSADVSKLPILELDLSKNSKPGTYIWRLTDDYSQVSDNNILIDPFFGEKFGEVCDSVIQKEIDFCKALREQKTNFVFNQSPKITYYSYYIKPFIAFDPLENDSVFYPPDEFSLCSVTPEFPADRLPELLPLYNQSMFVRYEEIVRNSQMLSVFDALIQTEQLNPGQFGEGFANVMQTNRAVIEENMSFGVDPVDAAAWQVLKIVH